MRGKYPWRPGGQIGVFYRNGLLLALASLLLLTGCGGSDQPEPLAASARILAFGDSLTEGTGASEHEAYHAVLASLIGREVINAGKHGEISAKGLRRLPALLEREKPALVIVFHGGNDIIRNYPAEQTASHLRQMIELSRTAGARVVLVGVPERGILLSTAELYEQVAEATGTPLIDGEIAEILRRPSLKSDAVHPNADGYRRIAEAIEKALLNAGLI